MKFLFVILSFNLFLLGCNSKEVQVSQNEKSKIMEQYSVPRMEIIMKHPSKGESVTGVGEDVNSEPNKLYSDDVMSCHKKVFGNGLLINNKRVKDAQKIKAFMKEYSSFSALYQARQLAMKDYEYSEEEMNNYLEYKRVRTERWTCIKEMGWVQEVKMLGKKTK